MSQKRYAYLIGANGPQTEILAKLKYAEKDAKYLAEALLASPCSFTKAEPIVADSPQPILAGLNRFVKYCEPSDLLLVHFSGHANYEGQLFLLCNSTDIDDCISSAIKINDIKSYLDKCKARHKVLVLDCCHAGAAHTGAFKGDQDIKSALQQTLEGSVNVILSACSRRDRTRELETLDEGAGFLSWVLTSACASRFQEVSHSDHSLSLMDIWHWIPRALQEVNSSLGLEEQLPQPILLSEMKAGDNSEIWLTEQRRAQVSKFVPDNELTRKKYLESVSKRYSSVTLPLGPTEGFSLHAVFQPLELRCDPLASEDLDYKKRRLFLGECLEDEEDEGGFQPERDEKEHADEKQRLVIAENGEDALTKSPRRRMVILGGPGTGKTTTLKHFVGCRAKEALTDSTAPIPIFLSLADLARSQKALQSYLVDLIEELGIERTYAETLWKAIEAGQAFVCLDSLDEVEPQRQRRQKMIEWINAWAAKPGNTWVIGSRFTEYKGGSFNHGQFAEWELLPMSHKLRQELAGHLLPELQRLLPNVPEKSLSPTTFVKLLEGHPEATAWGENPLLFSLAAVVFLRMGELPSSRAILYQQVIDAVLETREKDPMRRKVLRRVISDLALEFYKAKGRTFSLDELLALLPIIRQRQHENWMTEEMAHRIVTSGMLDVLAHETYGFRHQTFQEYLAAVELALRLTYQDRAVREEAWKFAWSKRTYSRWTEILRLMVGVLSQWPGNKGKSEAQYWLRELIKQRSMEEGDPGDLGLTLALKSLTEVTNVEGWEGNVKEQLEKDIISTWLKEILEAARDQRKTKQKRLQILARDFFHLYGEEVDKALKILIKALWDKNINVSGIAVKVLQELGQRVPIEPLLVVLDDSDIEMRRKAMEVLRWQGEYVPIEPLIKALNDIDGDVRRAAVEVLGKQGERMPIEPLLEALHDIDGQVQRAVVEVLGKQGERVPIEPLLEALHNGAWKVRWAVVEALGRQGERVPVEPLLEALHDVNGKVRRAAVEALGRQGEHVPIEPLLEALHDVAWKVRRAVVEVLGRQGERVPIEPLLEEALYDKHGDVRRAAVEVLGRQGERVPIEPLLEEALYDKHGDVRRAAVEVLGRQGERVPIEPLLEALHDMDGQMRWAAVEMLRGQKERVPIDPLLEVLHDIDGQVRRSAIKVLGEQGDRILLNYITNALHDVDGQVRQVALQALGKQGDRVPIEPLLEALHDADEQVRQAAVRVLREQGERVPIEPLLEALHDKYGKVWWAAVRVLREQGERVPIEPLLEALCNGAWKVRWAAVEALGRQRECVPIEPLLEALHDPDGQVQQAVVRVLREQGERVPIEPLLEALHDKQRQVRRAAVEALGRQGERVPVEPLLETLHDKQGQVRQAAVEALGRQGERVPVGPLLGALHDADEQVRQAALRVLGRQGERVPIEPLLEALHDADEDVRRAAVEALGRQGKRVPIEPLLEALHDKQGQVRRAAVEVLGRQGERVLVDLLLEALHDKQGQVRRAAVEALGRQGERVPIESLLEALHDADGQVRRAAVRVLREQGERVPIEPLLEALHDEDEHVRQAVVRVLREQGECVPIESLLEALHDTDADVRQVAVKALGRQGEHIPVEPLLEALHDENENVRSAAVEVLGEQGECVPVDLLLEALHDENENVRRLAVEALGRRGERVPVDLLLEALHDGNEDVRQAAIKALGKQGERVPIDYFLEAVGDEDKDVGCEAVKVLGNRASHTLVDVTNEAIAILNGQLSGSVLGSIAQTSFCKLVAEMKLALPAILDELTGLLRWPHWQVRTSAAKALGSIRRNVPDAAIRRLLELRRQDPIRVVREAADDALAEILSLETGIEDD